MKTIITTIQVVFGLVLAYVLLIVFAALLGLVFA